jgi:hypothetical protein
MKPAAKKRRRRRQDLIVFGEPTFEERLIEGFNMIEENEFDARRDPGLEDLLDEEGFSCADDGVNDYLDVRSIILDRHGWPTTNHDEEETEEDPDDAVE